MLQFDEITSRTNPKIKEASALLSSQQRKKSDLFLLEGARLCADAVKSGTEVVYFFATSRAIEKYPSHFEECRIAAAKTYIISESVAEKLSDTSETQQMFCVCKKFGNASEGEIDVRGFYLMTENIQNPDNLGAIARTCEALGVSGLLVVSGCDVYSPKALRASMGSLLRLPVIRANSPAEILSSLKSKGMKIFSTVVSAEARDIRDTDKSGGCVCVMGNEGNGVSEEVKALSDCLITVPMKGNAESLNAAAATAVTVWEFMKDR